MSFTQNTGVVLTTELPLPRVATGKVRDVYAVGNDALLLVATDRISAFDVVMRQGIPDKGRVLTQISAFWFEKLADICPNHFLSVDDATIRAALSKLGVSLTDEMQETLSGRAMLCQRTNPLPIEAVVRGYLSGSAWKAYRVLPPVEGSVDLWGVSLPAKLRESERLPEPLFTPSTKATTGHDEPMPRSEIAHFIGEYARPVEETALKLYAAAADYAAERGILLADTKFEFGTLPDGELRLIDEALTPDSSRFWEGRAYEIGVSQPSFDKQFVRDYLETVPGWNKQPPPPDLPEDIIARTSEKYREAFSRLTNRKL